MRFAGGAVRQAAIAMLFPCVVRMEAKTASFSLYLFAAMIATSRDTMSSLVCNLSWRCQSERPHMKCSKAVFCSCFSVASGLAARVSFRILSP